MSRGGFRGRGRGGYRGGSGGGGSSGGWIRGGGMRRGRGGENGFSGRGDRFNDWSDNSYGGGSDRFSSRSSSRMDDSGYRRFGGPGGYGKRELSPPDMPTKRMRTDSNSQASSMRRSQDESFGGRSEYRGYRGRGGGYGADKGSVGSYGSRMRDRPRSDSYPFRKSVSSFRGRFSSSRSIGRSRGRFSRGFRSDKYDILSRKLAVLESLNRDRMKTRDDLRRLKMSSMMKSFKELEKKMKSEEDINWDKEDDEDEDVEEEEVETEVEESVEEDDEEEAENEKKETKEGEDDEEKKDGELEEGESKEKGDAKSPKKKVVKKKVKKVVKKLVKKKTPTKKKESKEDEEEEEEEAADEGGEKAEKDNEKKDEKGASEETSGEKYECPRCKTVCLTEKGYNKHLKGAKHLASMQKLSVALRSRLSQMRVEQRREQRFIDDKRSSRNLETIFCSVCKLNYRCLTAAHMRSFRHQKMKKFLMPICRACGITARSPMQHEHHICEISHMKKAAQREKERELNKDNFMVLDAVGSQDEQSDEEKEDKDKSKDGEEKEKDGDTEKEGEKSEEKKKKSDIELGYEFCKQVSVMFCDLCESYLPQASVAMEETALAAHCRSRKHMDRFIQLKKYQRRSIIEKTEKKREEKELEEKKQQAAAAKEGKTVNGVAEKSPKKKDKGGADQETADDEKIWSALGDFLDQVEPTGKSSDDEEESGRYDRFKHSADKDSDAKNGDREGMEAEEEEEEDEDMTG